VRDGRMQRPQSAPSTLKWANSFISDVTQESTFFTHAVHMKIAPVCSMSIYKQQVNMVFFR
jgi:hypothetical protein